MEKEKIIELKKQNLSQREISKILGCSEGYVSRIVKCFGLSNNIDNNFIGKKFGSLSPIRRSGLDKNSHVKYLCLCDCGNSCYVLGNSLQTGNTLSCGCTSRKVGKFHKNWAGYEEIPNVYFNRVKRGAIERKIKFNISIEDMWSKFLEQDRKCNLSGILLTFQPTSKTRNLQTASLDRINSNYGYNIDNIQWVHKHLNTMKWKLHNNDFIEWCNLVSNHNKNKKGIK